MDISMPRLGGIEATAKIKEKYPKIKVLILTMHKEQEYLKRALDRGADGYLVKEKGDTELLEAISAIRHGDVYICPDMRQLWS
jgi:two-component system response regulator NreC